MQLLLRIFFFFVEGKITSRLGEIFLSLCLMAATNEVMEIRLVKYGTLMRYLPF